MVIIFIISINDEIGQIYNNDDIKLLGKDLFNISLEGY